MSEPYKVDITVADFGRAVRIVISQGSLVVSASATIPLSEFEQFIDALNDAVEEWRDKQKKRPSKRLLHEFAEEAARARGEDDPAT